MIKRLPGWANFLALWAFYFFLSWGISELSGWDADLRFIAFLTSIYCGGYLAKWRFYEKDGWRFW